MIRSAWCLILFALLLLSASCAQSMHQTQRLAMLDAAAEYGYAESPALWGGPRPWWYPFGYYGYPGYGYPGYGWYGGGSRGGTHRDSSPPAPRPKPPANAPPQFKKKS